MKADAVPKVYAAINSITSALAATGIAKGQKNTQQGYSFRGIDDVLNALSGLLGENHLCVLPRVLSREVTERATAKGGVLFYVVLQVEYDLVSSEDGSKHVVAVVGEAMDSADKATNKAMSAAYKNAAIQAFCIPTKGDNDADATTHTHDGNELLPDKRRVPPKKTPAQMTTELADHFGPADAVDHSVVLFNKARTGIENAQNEERLTKAQQWTNTACADGEITAEQANELEEAISKRLKELEKRSTIVDGPAITTPRGDRATAAT